MFGAKDEIYKVIKELAKKGVAVIVVSSDLQELLDAYTRYKNIGSLGMESFQPEAIARIAKQYPSLKIVVCHLLAPTLENEIELKRALTILKLDNVWFDLAAIPWNIYPEKYPIQMV